MNFPLNVCVFLYTTFGRTLDDLTWVKYLGYDHSCDPHPFLRNLINEEGISGSQNSS